MSAGEHDCQMKVAGLRHLGRDDSSVLSLSPPRTVVALRCAICGDLACRTIPGHWTAADLEPAG